MEEASVERDLLCPVDAVNVVDEEPARQPRVAPRPKAPTQADIDAHEPLHLDYRAWCAHCVGGRGHSAHHRSEDKDEIPGATWHMKYAFLREKCDVKGEETEAPGNATMLITYDEGKEAFWAMHAAKKGVAPGVAKWCCDRFEDSGYGGNSITVKSDQEESIVALRCAISVFRLGDTVPINSPVRCSKANRIIKMQRILIVDICAPSSLHSRTRSSGRWEFNMQCVVGLPHGTPRCSTSSGSGATARRLEIKLPNMHVSDLSLALAKSCSGRWPRARRAGTS